MSFQIVAIGKFCGAALGPNTVSIGTSGTLSIAREALASVGIRDRVVLLADAETLRLALRAPVPDGTESTAAIGGAPGTKRATIGLRPALRLLNLLPSAVRGRHDLIRHDDLLILNLASDLPGGPAPSRPRGRPRKDATK